MFDAVVTTITVHHVGVGVCDDKAGLLLLVLQSKAGQACLPAYHPVSQPAGRLSPEGA